MSAPEGEAVADVFGPGGGLRLDLLNKPAATALREALRLAGETRWDSLRSPHVFMGLLAVPDACVCSWGQRLRADLPLLLSQFQELFQQDEGNPEALLRLHREFLSDNVIRLLREAYQRTQNHGRAHITPIDLLISLLTTSNSIVAECFERIGISAATLARLAAMAERYPRGEGDSQLC